MLFEGKHFRGNALVRVGLARKFYGLGNINAARICARLGFYPNIRFHQLTEPDLLAMAKELNTYTIEDEKRQVMRDNLNRKRIAGTYSGRRHAMGYPIRGQRTKRNAQTAKRLNKVFRRGYSTDAVGVLFPSTTWYRYDQSTSSLPVIPVLS
ncbi:hypothetical protein V1508DRAFT_406581 [Lipomyces doorenjongii]|uniref:mitochondrial 37S ribosomal protein uS13m n=1 Tax=Lipomyces doorenjongii TaxID=383834 RepID=UPI0034CF864A